MKVYTKHPIKAYDSGYIVLLDKENKTIDFVKENSGYKVFATLTYTKTEHLPIIKDMLGEFLSNTIEWV